VEGRSDLLLGRLMVFFTVRPAKGLFGEVMEVALMEPLLL
jgi:hypothetical protein